MINGKHFIAGMWVAADETFRSSPFKGTAGEFARGNSQHVHDAVSQSAAAFAAYSRSSVQSRCSFLTNIAAELETIKSELIPLCCEETGLLESRVEGEFVRTVNQLRYFAKYIESNNPLDARHDRAQPDRTPLPRPDLKMLHRPIGPVAVFGASNFPLAFSTAGGDTAAALAAGCPVVVKGHPAHPGTADLVAQAIDAAIRSSDVPGGVFSQIQSDTFEAGESLVQHPEIKAVGFTGSLNGGRYLYNLCASRPEPIPFFGELGSVNPVFILRGALEARTETLAKEWVTSLTFGSGQLCTNPGIVILDDCGAADRFIDSASEQLNNMESQPMLSDSITDAFKQGHDRIQSCSATTVVNKSICGRRSVTPAIFKAPASSWLAHDHLAEEVFGPLGQVVTVTGFDEMQAIANALEGQLTCTIHIEKQDSAMAKDLLPVIEDKAGRIIINGFPTGVEVCDSMVHGGPYPASTNFGATSVGSLSIRRFLRPVCYQNVPDDLLSASVPYSMKSTMAADREASNVSVQSVSKTAWYKADSRNR